MKVKDKKIIVTGGGSGIGRELTLQLLDMGAHVAAVDISEKSLKEVQELAKNNERLSIHVLDVTSDESLKNFEEEFYKKHKVVDGLINNAGIVQPFVNVDKLEMDLVNRVMNVNFFGPFKLTRMFLPELKKRPSAHIVNVSSMGGFFPVPGQTVYGASKAALKLFTEGLYAELLDTNVRVTIVFPGGVATNIMENSHVEYKNDGESGMKMTTAKSAAEQIIKAMEKDKFQLFVGNDSKMMNIIYKLNPKSATKMIKKKMTGMDVTK